MQLFKKIILACSLTLFAFVQIMNSQEIFSRISFDKTYVESIAKLGIPIDDAFIQKNTVIMELSSSDLTKISDKNIDFKIIIHDVSKYYADRNKKAVVIQRTNKTPDNFNLGSMGGNLTYAEVLAELTQMQSLYPNLISVKQSISDNYTTHNDSIIYWVRISDNPMIDEEEPEILYTALHHAREPLLMMHLIYYMWYLLENYDSDPKVQYMVDNFEQYFVPVVNIDGYMYNQQTDPNGGGMFRKNRLDNGDGTFGVDINRNYPYQWGYDDDGSSPYTYDETYRGASAGSEPEIQAMMEFVESHEFIIANNHHTYSNLMLYPYGYDENAVNPDLEIFRAYAQIMTRENNFSCGRAWELLYPVNGDANDWMYNQMGVYSFTAETGDSDDGFWPDQSNIIPLCEGNLYMDFMQTLLVGAYVEVNDASSHYFDREGYLKFNAQFLGLDTTGSFKIYLSGTNIVHSDTVFIDDYSFMETMLDSISYVISDNVLYGEDFSFELNVDNGYYVEQQTLNKIIQNVEIYFDDDGDDLINWTTTGWGITSSEYHSVSSSITDSPNGDYSSGQTNSITSSVIDLTGVESASVSFWAKWSIESGWDYVSFLVSTNGGASWNYIETENTVSGNGGVQPYGQPVFDGTQSSWINQTVDISEYTGNNVQFRFVLGSDSNLEYDGFYFDDFQVLVALPMSMKNIADYNFQIYPNPASEYINIVADHERFSEVNIIDITGKILKSGKINSDITQVTLEYFEPGVYFVQLIGQSIKMQKILIVE
ncbi:MAG: immune inhibitor A [Bacteroidales bacterium]|nr:immune inhibitor A [Bacteroidales bacterium]